MLEALCRNVRGFSLGDESENGRCAVFKVSVSRKPLLNLTSIGALGMAVVFSLVCVNQGCAQTVASDPNQEITGTWQGVLHVAVEMHLVVKIMKADGGGYRAVFYGIDSSGEAVPANAITFRDGTVKWTVTADGSYEGELDTNGNTIKGEWSGLLSSTPVRVILTRVPPELAQKILVSSLQQSQMAANAHFTYDVISIRPSKANEGMSLQPSSDGILIPNTTLLQLIFNAYNVNGTSNISKDYQVSGLPGWALSSRFNVEAKMDMNTMVALQRLPPKEQWRQRQFMLQALLEDRFKLKIRHGTKELPIYALVFAKGGFKLKESQATRMGGMAGEGRINFTALSIDDFTFTLSGDVDRVVVNKTGLKGKYDIALRWTPDEMQSTTDSGPSIFTALQEQLGLKLEPTRGPVNILVIDHVEKPSAN